MCDAESTPGRAGMARQRRQFRPRRRPESRACGRLRRTRPVAKVGRCLGAVRAPASRGTGLLSQELIQESEEDLRRERALKLWKEYGKYAVAAAIVVIGAVGGFVAWREYQNREAMAESNRFFEALAQVQ